jgi:adenosylhomocysteine nucleosidase
MQEQAPKGADQLSPGRKPWIKREIQPTPVGTAQALTHVHKSVAIVTAMRKELAPLLRGKRLQRVEGVDLFEMDSAVVAVGGIGEKCARRAAEAAIEYAQPKLLLSAGIAGAISLRLKVGDVGRIREVVDVATGDRYPTRGGEWVLATSQDVSDAAEKQELLTKFGADVVDMEGAAVAQVARERGLQFAAVKSISDDAGLAMPPLTRFIDKNGKFANGRFLLYVALRPKWWPVLGKIRANTAIASANLCRAVVNLIESSCQ